MSNRVRRRNRPLRHERIVATPEDVERVRSELVRLIGGLRSLEFVSRSDRCSLPSWERLERALHNYRMGATTEHVHSLLRRVRLEVSESVVL